MPPASAPSSTASLSTVTSSTSTRSPGATRTRSRERSPRSRSPTIDHAPGGLARPLPPRVRFFRFGVAGYIPGQIVLADSAYGRVNDFRDTVFGLGLDYAVATDADTQVSLLDAIGRRRGAPRRVKEIAAALGLKAFRRVTWRDGTKRKMFSRFAFRRVKIAHDPDGRDPVWLVIEWPVGEEKATNFFLTTLRRRLSKKRIVRIIKERWRTERVYEEMKGELGLDHFEGRSFPGWHHHVSVVLCCYAFVVAERVRHFPPQRGRRSRHRPLPIAA